MKKRSVLFFRNSYYHFYYLAKALRKRGWDAIVVSPDDPSGADAFLFHGEDLNIYDNNRKKFHNNVATLLKEAKERFELLHFCGDNMLGLYPESVKKYAPPEILEWKSLGKKIAYTPSGCLSATSQSSVSKWSLLDGKNTCDVCRWQNEPHVCSDYGNLHWGRKINSYADIIFSANLPFLDYLSSGKSFRTSIICLDPEVWSDTLKIPVEFNERQNSGEIIIYHGVGNYNRRTTGGKNIKGTSVIFDAIEKLQTEGFNCRLIFKQDMANINLRYIQAQADIVVDELNNGRYGATSRECMMLGKPVICYINKNEVISSGKLDCLDELPLVSATEETIYNKLKELVLNESLRAEIGKASREYAVKWHSADVCAEVYEKVYDELMETGEYDNKLTTIYSQNIKTKNKDIFDNYIGLSNAGEFSEKCVIDTFTTNDYFISKWGAYLEYAWLYRKVQNYINIREETGICSFGNNFEKALIELEFGKDKDALTLLKLALPLYADRSEQFAEISLDDYYFLMAQVAYRSQDFIMATNSLAKTLEINGEKYEALLQLADLNVIAGKFRNAKELYERAYLTDPTKKSVLHVIGVVNKKLSLPETDIESKNTWLNQKIILSENYIQTGELSKAQAVLENLEVVFPDNVDVLNNISVLELMCGNIESAAAYIHKILLIDPLNETALENKKYLDIMMLK